MGGRLTKTARHKRRKGALAAIAAQHRMSMLRDGRFLALALVLMALAGVAAFTAWRQMQDARAERVASIEQEDKTWRAQGEVNPHIAAHFGRYVFKPIPTLAFFDPGLSAQLGRVARLEAHIQAPPRDRPSDWGNALTRFSGLSAASLLQTFLPLLIVMTGFALFSGERARTLMRQELGVGAKPGLLVMGRLFSHAGLLGAMLAPFFLAVLIFALSIADHAEDALLLAGASILCYALYLLIWCGVTLGVSARCRSARASLAILLGLWILSVVLAPRFAAGMGERMIPTPATPVFQLDVREELRRAIDGHNQKDPRLEVVKQELFRRYNVSRVEDLPVNFSGIALVEGEREGARIANAQYERLWSIYERQTQIQKGFALISPLEPLRSASAILAGGDLRSHIDFSRAMETYRLDFVQRLNAFMAYNSTSAEPDFKATGDLLTQFKPFQYAEPEPLDRLARAALDMALLGLWTFAALLFAVRGAARWSKAP